MRRVALALLLVACKTTSSANSQASAKVDTQTDAQGKVTTVETVRTGPETVTTTISEYAVPAEAPKEEVMSSVPQVTQGVTRRSTRGPLVKRTVVVDQRAPAVQETHTQASGATETRTETKAEATAQTAHANAPGGILGGLLSMWPLLLLAGLALAGWVGWKVLRSRVP